MKVLFVLLLATFISPVTWLGNFSNAEEEAAKAHKLILVNFSGSDWCVPCIRLRKEILESTAFQNYASENLVLVRADFPRQKKNQPAKEQVKLNEALAEQYNPDGKFPYTLLVDEHGKILKSWDGYPEESAQQFVLELQHFSYAGK